MRRIISIDWTLRIIFHIFEVCFNEFFLASAQIVVLQSSVSQIMNWKVILTLGVLKIISIYSGKLATDLRLSQNIQPLKWRSDFENVEKI